jgi:hypothetical protein
MAAFKKGDAVRQIVPAPIEGVVTGFHVDQETGDMQFRVEWANAEGEACGRYFTAAQLQAVAADA